MSSVPSNEGGLGVLSRLKKYRRKKIKKYGKKLIYGLEKTLARASLVENKPFAETTEFPQLLEIEKNWEKILDEVRVILQQREAIPGFQEVSPDQHKLAIDGNWRTFFLYGFGIPFAKNSSQAPFTSKVIAPTENLQTAWFSILDTEWPVLRDAFTTWLDPDNFDDRGRQRASLSKLVEAARRKR